MYQEPPNASPSNCPPSDGRAECTASAGDELQAFDWAALVPRLVHPVQVAIIESLTCLNRPLSATEMSKLFGVKGWYVGIVAYHVNQLATAGVIEEEDHRQVRGAREKFYFFAGPQ
jgi:hypothetical protein